MSASQTSKHQVKPMTDWLVKTKKEKPIGHLGKKKA